MADLIPKILISTINRQNNQNLSPNTSQPKNQQFGANSQIKELANLPTSNILAQFAIGAVPIEKSPEKFWDNDLKTLFNTNQAVILAIVPRIFNSKDFNKDGIIDGKETKGTFLNAIERLDEIKQMGINTLHILPVNPPGKKMAMGTAGSLYSPRDLLSIDEALDDPTNSKNSKEEFREFIDECHKRKIRVMLDLPSCGSYDMFLAHPELMAYERNGLSKTPQGWNDIKMFAPWHDESKKILNPHLLELHKKYVDMCLDLGIDGIRADVARAKPVEFWDIIIPYSHSKDPNFAWLAESYTYEDASPQINMPQDRPHDLLKAGFDAFYGQYHIFHEWTKAKEFKDYIEQNLKSSEKFPTPKSLIGSFATHDDVSPMFHGGVEYCNLTTGLQATIPMTNPYFVDGFQSGDYYLYPYENAIASRTNTDTKKLTVHKGKLDIFNQSRRPGGRNPEIGSFLKATMDMRKKYLDIITKGSFIDIPVLENPEDKIIAYARHYQGKTLLIIANRDINKRQTGLIKVPRLSEAEPLVNLLPSYGEKSELQIKERGKIIVDLGQGRIHVFEINTPDIENSDLKSLKQKI